MEGVITITDKEVKELVASRVRQLLGNTVRITELQNSGYSHTTEIKVHFTDEPAPKVTAVVRERDANEPPSA